MSYLSKVLVVALFATMSVANAETKKEEKSKLEVAEAKDATAESTTAALQDKSLINSDLAIYHLSDVITVSYINSDLKPAVFTITDAEGSSLYSKTTRNNLLVHYRLNTDKLPEGKYFATLKVGPEKYTKEFSIAR